MDKKGGYDFAIYSPFTLIAIILMILVFGIFFFVFGGAFTPDITVSNYELPETTLSDLMNSQNSTGQTFYQMTRDVYTEYIVLRESTCANKRNLVECQQLSNNELFKSYEKEITEWMKKLEGPETLWLIKFREFPYHDDPELISLYAASGSEVITPLAVISNTNKVKSSNLIIPLNKDKSLIMHLVYEQPDKVGVVFDQELAEQTQKQILPQKDDPVLVSLAKSRSFAR